MENEEQQISKSKRGNRYLVYLVLLISSLFVVVLVSVILLRGNRKKQQLIVERMVAENVITPTPTPQVRVTSIPKTVSPGEKIVSANLDEDCIITITSSKNTYEITNGLGGGMGFKCNPSIIGKVSPSGKYLAYEDVSGGIDSVMALFALEYSKDVTLGVWGTSTIMDYMFLPDDRLVAINGYPEIFDEQWLSLFDLPNIFDNFPLNFDIKNYYLNPHNPTFMSNIQLPNTGQNHAKLANSDNFIKTIAESNNLLVQYTPEYIVLNNSSMPITPHVAVNMAFNYHNNMYRSQNTPLTENQFNPSESTFDYWVVDILISETGEQLRSYKVNRKTGEIINNY